MLFSLLTLMTNGFLIPMGTKSVALSRNCRRVLTSFKSSIPKDNVEQGRGETTSTRRPKQEITSTNRLNELWNEIDDESTPCVASCLSVRGDTQIIGSPESLHIHPVVRVLHERKRKQASMNVTRKNGSGSKTEGKEKIKETQQQRQKIALVIEGGGM